MYGNGCAGIDGERREHRKDLRLEVLVDRAPFAGRQVSYGEQPHAVVGQLVEQIRRDTFAEVS